MEPNLQPYPGLRPFEPDEAIKFYGRETHTAELLRRLAENRFIAVVGNSGSGKSSLVRAGLLPALYRGRLIGATSQWRICIMRPGEHPMAALAAALAKENIHPEPEEDAPFRGISSSTLGLSRAVRSAQLPPGESLLLVVDQFEELFRFARERRDRDEKDKETEGRAEARLFVASLLEAALNSSAPVYVVLTMRSDFLGYCGQFPNLPEALNRSQYLVPNLTRDQLRDAIEKPVRLVGANMSPKLVERLLNEIGDNTGQLPILQHALNRTFGAHDFAASPEIGVADYTAAGEMKDALNAHANKLLAALVKEDPAYERLTERVFRCLTTTDGARKIRRPTRLDLLFQIVGAKDEPAQSRVRHVIGTYADPGASMLVVTDGTVDITHETLIANWTLLEQWVEVEAESKNLYLAAAQDAKRSLNKSAAQWRSLKLEEALCYLKDGTWNEPWADRLDSGDASFDAVMTFIAAESDAQRKAERRRWTWIIVIGLLVIAVLGLALAVTNTLKARAEAEKALLELRNSEVLLRSQIQASDDLIAQNTAEQNSLLAQIERAARDPAEKTKLQAQLLMLRAKRTELDRQRNEAQSKLSRASKNQTRVNPIDGLTYVYIPVGKFKMGCSPGDKDCRENEANPPKDVTIDKGFWLGQTEVTQAAWKKVTRGENPSNFKSDQLPVEQVDWYDADKYCKAVGGRLPTEEQWEYAARAGTTGPRYGELDAIAWYNSNSGGTTHPVATKLPNAFGLYDMLGNVWEWTSTDYDKNTKVLRGASWGDDPGGVRVAGRGGGGPTERGSNVGFRCVGELP